MKNEKLKKAHYVKSVGIRSYYGPYFPAFGLNTERFSYSVQMRENTDRNNSEYGNFLRSVISWLKEFQLLAVSERDAENWNRNTSQTMHSFPYWFQQLPILLILDKYFRGGSRAAATSKIERFVIIVNGF